MSEKLSKDQAKPEFMKKAVLWEKGNKFEDFEVGQEFIHHWGRTINSGDNSLFSSLTLHFNPMYFNAEYAKAHGHQKIPVNPLLVFNTVLGLSVEDLSEAGGPFVGINECEYGVTVYEGDTITASSSVIAKRESKKMSHMGIVSWLTQGFNQHGEVVVKYKRSNLILKKGHTLI